jgi:hypothetical protein
LALVRSAPDPGNPGLTTLADLGRSTGGGEKSGARLFLDYFKLYMAAHQKLLRRIKPT